MAINNDLSVKTRIWRSNKNDTSWNQTQILEYENSTIQIYHVKIERYFVVREQY